MKKAFAAFLRALLAAMPFLMLLTVIACVLLSNPVYDKQLSKKVAVSGGRVDLSFNRRGITQIQGEWAFLWRQFVTAEEFRKRPKESLKMSVLPGAWKNAGVSDIFGYASYALEVSGLDPDRMYAIRIGQTLSACEIIVNDRYLSLVGRPGTTAETEVPFWNAVNTRFCPRDDGTATIVFHISNFHDRCGGSNLPMYIGDAALMGRMDDSQHLTEGVNFSVLTIMGLFFLILYISRRKDRYFLWFSFICIAVGIRALCYDGFTLLTLIPVLPWPLYFRLGFLTFPAFMIAFIAFLRAIFPQLVHRLALTVTLIFFGSFCLITVFAPEYFASLALNWFELGSFGFALYGIVVIVIAAYKHLESAVWLLVGFSLAILSFTYDLLISLWIISGVFIGSLGMCFCMFCLGLMVIARYSESFRSVRELSAELAIINRSMQRFVPSEFLSFLEKESIADVSPGDCVETYMAILSADIRSFTSISEQMEPKDVFLFLNDYLNLVGPIIRNNGGFIAKYEGDGFLALFPEGPESAVKCAVQMQSAISGRNRIDARVPPIYVGIGIDAGPLVLGTIGDDSRIDSTVVSSCVKCAGLFEAATKQFHSRILVNGSVFSGLTDPLSWFLRPVERFESDDVSSFLFEIYNNDQEHTRELKWKTQSDLEHAVYAYYSGQLPESRYYISRILETFPDDPVANHYFRLLQS